MDAPILEVEDLRVYYKTVLGEYKAIDGVSFTVNKEEILGIWESQGAKNQH